VRAYALVGIDALGREIDHGHHLELTPMCTSNTLRVAALVVSISFAVHAAPQAVSPSLQPVTAPFVGRTLTLRLDGAAASSAVDLYFSHEVGSATTPYGVLELRRNRMLLLGSGVTDSAGVWTFDFPIPLDPAYAERGAHFQALVDEPSAPTGRSFSQAVHARFLGPRVYAGYGTSLRAGVQILSAVTDTVVASADCAVAGAGYGFPREGKPVFDTAYSSGAVMISERELMLFDPYFGGVRGRVPYASTCARTVFTDAARRTVFVLELAGGSSPARVHAVDIASGAETGALDLPSAVEPIWCQNGAATEVYLAEFEPGGRTAVRRLGLVPLADLGSAPVGIPESRIFRTFDGQQEVPLPMHFAGGQVFVSTLASLPGPELQGSLTRCWPAPSGITTDLTHLGPWSIYKLEAVPSVDRLLGGIGATMFGPAFVPIQMPLSAIGPPTTFTAPLGSTEFYIHDVEPDGRKAWVVAEWEWQHHDVLYRLDLQTNTWTQYPHSWFLGPSDAEVVHDRWNRELWVSNLGIGPPVSIAPEILVVDDLHGTTRHIELQRTARVLHAVPLP
jgi:hypothetical protein